MSRDIGCTTKRLQERFRNLRQKAKKQQQQQNAPLLTTQASAEVHLSSTDPVEELPPGQLFLRELEDVENNDQVEKYYSPLELIYAKCFTSY
ncbi:unnamed protein product [Rotaria sordida]|uniref:Uncharacterized protein n=1 Tax=Rotaria sordida TaxID=392033 RepID=A0A813VPK0_9BILA|nr:unnamed protein product [Rotaria sordida]CAF3877015.1 unnamed protein product [Rotaria sordida]CAF3883775.1 unnamed protein product [Rotaria sordida]